MSGCCVVTCKGRLDFLKRTVPTFVDQRAATYCLVDYLCPQASGDWLEAQYRGRPDVAVVRVPGRERFHKTHANNRGAAHALELGASHLMFADADTLFADGSLARFAALLAPGHFLIAGRTPDDRTVRSLTGFIVLSADDFVRSGGYDETFEGWGAEDIEFRLRLFFELNLVPIEVPYGLLEALGHDDGLRTAYYREKDPAVSLHHNREKLLKKLIAWSGKGFEQQTGPATRLLFS